MKSPLKDGDMRNPRDQLDPHDIRLDGKFEMTNEEFDELSLQTQLGALFRQSQKNYFLLSQIREVCACRMESCSNMFVTKKDIEEVKADLEKKITTKSILAKAVTAAISGTAGAISGFFSGKFG